MTRLFRRLRARLRYRHFQADLQREVDVHRAMAEDSIVNVASRRSTAVLLPRHQVHLPTETYRRFRPDRSESGRWRRRCHYETGRRL